MNITWDAEGYKERFAFVHQYGEDVMSLLTVCPGSTVVDLGCGNGALSEKLAERGFRVIGVDGSEDMIALARAGHPELEFIVADATEFQLPGQVDAVFSNAVFHWIDADKQDQLIANVAAWLKPGGELVCEFGGFGCAETVHSTLERCFAKRGLVYPRTFYFPTIGEYTPILERHGLRVDYAILFDRPTVQQAEDGLTDWIDMFDKKPFEGMEPGLKNDILREANELLADTLRRDGRWFIDYVRIRIRAKKVTK